MKADQLPSFRVIPADSVCVEVGTWIGNFSYEILKNTSCKKLYCVDPFKHFENNEYPDAMNNLSQDDFDKMYEKVKARLAEFGDRVSFLRMNSTEASKLFLDGTIDFVYIDGNHDYSYVLQDILHWYPKVKQGGFLNGDDVYSTDLSEHDTSGNVTRVWGPECWGKYGTYKAVVDAQKTLGYNFRIEESQFIIKKDL